VLLELLVPLVPDMLLSLLLLMLLWAQPPMASRPAAATAASKGLNLRIEYLQVVER
jgi:hypothetical protein